MQIIKNTICDVCQDEEKKLIEIEIENAVDSVCICEYCLERALKLINKKGKNHDNKK